MPYIVTTKRPIGVSKSLAPACKVSRRAVVTLEEAGEAFHEALFVCGIEPPSEEWGDWAMAWHLHISEPGGTVGPLPDGTVIEVEPVEWDDIRRVVGAVGRRGATNDPMMVVRSDQLIAAFNAREVA